MILFFALNNWWETRFVFLKRCRTGGAEPNVRPVRRRCTMPRRSSVTAGASTRPASSAVSSFYHHFLFVSYLVFLWKLAKDECKLGLEETKIRTDLRAWNLQPSLHKPLLPDWLFLCHPRSHLTTNLLFLMQNFESCKLRSGLLICVFSCCCLDVRLVMD